MAVFEKQDLFRIIDPKFGKNNIYRYQAGMTVSLGPVMIATVASQSLPWLTAEVISENNYKKKLGAPVDEDGLPDHLELQKFRPARYVGISASMTNAVPRALEIIKTYLNMPKSLAPDYIIVGGWHAGDLPKEFLELARNVIVVHGEGEVAISLLLTTLRNGASLSSVPGISYWNKDSIVRNDPKFLTVPQEEMGLLPIPNFNLVRYAKIIFLPLQRTRGCSGNCRFCRVRTNPRYISPKRFLEIMKVVISQDKGRREFFFVDDRSEEDLPGFRQVLKGMIQFREEEGVKLRGFAQVRVTLGKDGETLELMHQAGIEMVAVGCESPIPAELKAMRKPISNPEKIAEWVHGFTKHKINVHMMLIFGYPMPPGVEKPLRDENGELLTVKKRSRYYVKLFRKSKPSFVQVLLFTPVPGTPDWEYLEKQNRIRKDIGWEHFDGTHLVYIPDEELDPIELQNEPVRLMGKFYSSRRLWMFTRLFLLWHCVRFALVTLSTPFLCVWELPFAYRPGFGLKKWFQTAWQNPLRVFRRALKYVQAQWIMLDWKEYFKESDFMKYWERVSQQKS